MSVQSDKIVSAIPIVKVFKLIGKLLKLSKGGLTKEEGLDLLDDLAEIASDLAMRI